MTDSLRNLSKRIKKLQRLESCLDFSTAAIGAVASSHTPKAPPTSSEEELSKLLASFLRSVTNLKKIERNDSAATTTPSGPLASAGSRRLVGNAYSMISEIEYQVRILERLEEDCDRTPPKIDVYYVIDLSSSMGQLYDDGAGTKMEAAKQAIIQTTNMIQSWTNGSQYGLITFYGSQRGVGNPATYGVWTTNLLISIFDTNGLTSDINELTTRVNSLSANGTTPTSHAIRFAYPELERDGIAENTPVFILLSDGVPTLSQARHSYNDADVQAINIKNGDAWLTADEIRAMAAGPPLADAMEAIEDMASQYNFKMHAIGIQGQSGNTFNSDILEYIAHISGGAYFDALSLDQLNEALRSVLNN
jgi:Mg-chelatase subunit ChlD